MRKTRFADTATSVSDCIAMYIAFIRTHAYVLRAAST